MEMILDNNFYTPLLIDRDFELIDEENNTLQADWQYKVDGDQDLNGDSDNMGDSDNIELKQIKAEITGIHVTLGKLKDSFDSLGLSVDEDGYIVQEVN